MIGNNVRNFYESERFLKSNYQGALPAYEFLESISIPTDFPSCAAKAATAITLDIAAVELPPLEHMSRSCRCPPATSLALIVSNVPSALYLFFKNILPTTLRWFYDPTAASPTISRLSPIKNLGMNGNLFNMNLPSLSVLYTYDPPPHGYDTSPPWVWGMVVLFDVSFLRYCTYASNSCP